MDVDQRNNFTEKPLRQFLFVQPGGLRRHIVAGISFCLRSGLENGFLDGEPLAVSAAVQLLSQFPNGSLICFLRTAGAVVVEPDSQFLKGHALLVGLANSQITTHQIQLSGAQHLPHALEEQRPAHEAVVGPGGVTTTTKVKDTLTQRLDLKHSTVFFQQTLGYFGGDFQLLLNDSQQIFFGILLLVYGIEKCHLAQLAVTVQRERQRERTMGGAVPHGCLNGGGRIGQQLCSIGGIKPCRCIQQCQRPLLLEVVHQKILRKLLAVACGQHGQISLVLGEQERRGLRITVLYPQGKLLVAWAEIVAAVHTHGPSSRARRALAWA